jgi:TRAP-type mannitol/chloroaromatic compound transport system substrate-binding protein
MKKRIWPMMLITVLVLSLVGIGCPPRPVVDPAVPVAPPVIEWIAQDDNPVVIDTFISLERVARNIEIASGGRLVIAAHPGGAIVPADHELMAVHEGILDLASNGPILWAGILPDAPIFSRMVGGPTAVEYFFWYMVGPGLDLMNEMFEDAGLNVKAIAAVCRMPETFLYTNFFIDGPEDLDGRMLRLLGDEAVIFAPLGVGAVATPSPEIYEAMALGVIDGFQHIALHGDYAMGFYEVVDYAWVSPVRQSTDVYIYIVNKDSWAALPEDLRVLVTELMWAEGIRSKADMTLAETGAAAKWIAEGVQVLPAPRSLEEAVIRLSDEFYTRRAAEYEFFARVWESLIEWRDKYAMYPRL